MKYKSRKNVRKNAYKNTRQHTRKNTRKRQNRGGTLMTDTLTHVQDPYEAALHPTSTTYSLEEVHAIRKSLIKCGLNVRNVEYCLILVHKLEPFIQPEFFIKTFIDISKKPIHMRYKLVYKFLKRINECIVSLIKMIENEDYRDDEEEDDDDNDDDDDDDDDEEEPEEEEEEEEEEEPEEEEEEPEEEEEEEEEEEPEEEEEE